jgi:hypothetical protein
MPTLTVVKATCLKVEARDASLESISLACTLALGTHVDAVYDHEESLSGVLHRREDGKPLGRFYINIGTL